MGRRSWGLDKDVRHYGLDFSAAECVVEKEKVKKQYCSQSERLKELISMQPMYH
ncbi:hypothetical protein QJS10_CPB20g00235 [Acorus calamus]|uniref:Uncharacterized protein n=1 Tax=Acorus calamus TaxID=4465 RepID=A0AAV9CAM0_ACOCL|nr:hypothetical protein QJS10_CPB20g00235 [Acorus calamus]